MRPADKSVLHRRGVSLIELLVAITIILIIFTLVATVLYKLYKLVSTMFGTGQPS